MEIGQNKHGNVFWIILVILIALAYMLFAPGYLTLGMEKVYDSRLIDGVSLADNVLYGFHPSFGYTYRVTENISYTTPKKYDKRDFKIEDNRLTSVDCYNFLWSEYHIITQRD